MPAKTTKEIFVERLKNESIDAGYRVAATQLTNGVKNGIVALLKDKGMESEKIKAVSEMLDSEVGAALISSILGYGLPYAPTIGEDPRVQRLAAEFRINGMATAGNFAFDNIYKYMMPAITNAMNALPAVEKAEEVESETSQEEKKAASAR